MRENKENIIKLLMRNIYDGKNKKYILLRFIIVGGINTIHNYIWYNLFLSIGISYMIGFTLAFIISMIGSFFLNCYFTFKTKPTLNKFIKFPLTTLANYFISTIMLYIIVNIFKIEPFIAGLLASILPIPITFIMTKLLLKEENLKLKKINGKNIVYIIGVLIAFLGIAILNHRIYLFGDKNFTIPGTDSSIQFMYFVPFIEKVIDKGDILWSWTYGLGGDVLGEFTYYYTSSPFFYISYIIKKIVGANSSYLTAINFKLYMSILKEFILMILMYSLFRYEGRKKYTSFVGAMAYGLSIIFLRNSLAFDYMTDAMIWLPLTILGYKIWEKKKKNFILILGITLTVLNSFYFGYMSLIFYCIFAIVFTYGEGLDIKAKIKSYFKKGLQFGMKIILSMGISSFLFIPAIIAFMNSDRFSINSNVPKLFNLEFYKLIFENIFLYKDFVGIPLVAILVFTVPIRKVSTETRKKTILATIFIILYMLPLSYSMFNGFSYVSYRWLYIFNFVVAYAIPNWMEESNIYKIKGAIKVLLIVLFTVIMLYTKSERGGGYVEIIDIAILFSGIASIVMLYIRKMINNKVMKSILEVIIILCILVGGIENSKAHLINVYENKYYFVTNEYFNNRGIDNDLERQILAETIPNTNEFYRTIYEIEGSENTPMNYMNYGASAYNSLINKNVHRWMKVDYNIAQNVVSPSRFSNFDNRLFLESAFGVRYKLIYNDENLPYGYKIKSVNDKYILYENDNTVGFDLWYDSYENIDKLENLNYAERDALLLKTALIDKDVIGIEKNELKFDTIHKLEVDYNSVKLSNVEYKDNKLYVGESGEIVLPIENKYRDGNGEMLFTINIRPENGQLYKMTINDKKLFKDEEGGQWTYPLNEFTFKMQDNTEYIKITLTPGTYIVNKVDLQYSSYEKYDEWVKDRNKYNIDNLLIDGSYVSGNITNDEKGILALNIPYKNGWIAKVDGKKVDLLKVNGIFTGIELEQGSHSLELRYITPGLILGGIISIASLVLCVILYSINRRK